ncbi:MAG: hypothetical protein AB1671_04120 [Thermodesulfobacteriota bacterium]
MLGWEQYQGRLWEGFHRHAVTVMLADSVLVWRAGHERPQHSRRGRPRGAFSPRPACRRCPFPALHRSIADWLRAAALRELFITGRIPHFRPLRI